MTIEPYNYNDEPSGRSETLVQALEKCERLEKQLEIAVEALNKYANKANWENNYTIDLNDWELELKVFDDGEVNNGEFYAQEALHEIKDLEK